MKASLVLIGAAAAVLAGCATPSGYNTAFSEKGALPSNSHHFDAPMEQTFRAAASALVQRGFNIDQADPGLGLIKASRNLDDPKDQNVSYLVTSTAYITSSPQSPGSLVTVSAAQQTVMHHSSHNWASLGPIPLPIPTGTNYQTVVTGEGGVKDPNFYTAFFALIDQNLGNSSSDALAASAFKVDAPPAVPPPTVKKGRGQ